MKYTARSLLYSVFVNVRDYEDATSCINATSGAILSTAQTCAYGFYCPGQTGAASTIACFGRTGEQMLTSLGVTFGVVSPDVNWSQDVGIILAIGVAFKLWYALSDNPAPPIPTPCPPAPHNTLH